jgi:hypothetical protein
MQTPASEALVCTGEVGVPAGEDPVMAFCVRSMSRMVCLSAWPDPNATPDVSVDTYAFSSDSTDT